MMPDFITDKSKIAKYTYADVEEIFLDNYEDVLKKYIAGGKPSDDTTKNYYGRILSLIHIQMCIRDRAKKLLGDKRFDKEDNRK